ncbi:secretin N-terminal domain-containing protein [Planctomicrobium piriforme]|uniref:Type II secretion system protein D n=1 Tax=Planctomicrobium piriforme TaxID=1576369 RepID=A0A1I3ICR7_9PLAN|nr:secretin N-terminal domain-containing protein [Planctomicrobium piriforme]SFI45669.1 type II secretion system protein D [Planctomicrobium piriforme]
MIPTRLMEIGRLLALLAAMPLVCPCAFTHAGEPTVTRAKKSSAEISAKPNAGEGQCRLGFLRKPWGEVIEQVAKETGSTLEMPETPPGYFSRTDFEKHNREDAIRILNRDLEKQGYRLVGKNDVLEVVSIKKKQPEFERHQVQPNKPTAPVQTASATDSPPIKERQSIVPVNHETPAPAQAPVTSSTLRPQNRSALDLAKQLHVAFKQRSKLENAGPHGLPAFVVEHFDPALVKAGQPLFVLEIDTANNALLITAVDSVQSGVKQLLGKLDVNPLETESPKLMVGNGQTAETGRKLAQPLSLIAQARTQQPANSAAPETDAIPMPPTGAPAAGAATPLPALLGNLRGDVSIEALNDLDLLILRGNEKDVEAVMQVIKAVEQTAVGSLPEIHLLRLRFVDSQSLSQLLNDVYTRMTELRSNNAQQNQVAVRVVPVVVPNAVLILAPSNAMQAVLQLAEELDQPIDPTHEVHIFRLKHAVSSSVAEMLTSFYAQPPVGLGARLKVASDPRTNSVIVQASARDLSEISEFIKGVDSEQAGAISQMRIFPLKSAVAEELAAFLNNAIQGVLNAPRTMTTTGAGGVAQPQATGTANQQAKATVIEFLREGSTELIRSGLLNDIRFSADPRTNSLIITAPEQSMPLVEELIMMLDRPSSAISEIKVFPLKNADATSAATLLEELFSTTPTQGNQTGRAGQAGALGIELLGAQGTGSSLIPLRFSVDGRTNSVVAIGGGEALRIVEAILFKLDTNDARNRQTTVIKLRNSPVADVAAAINEFLQAQRELATLDPNRISTSQLLEQEIIVTAEPVTNSLLISATPAYFKQLEELAKKLDAEPPQVVIQAMLVEVTLDNTDEFGVELGFQDPILFARSAIGNLVTTTTTQTPVGQPQVTTTNVISQQATPGFSFNNQPLGNNNSPGSSPSTVGTQGLSNFALGRTNEDLGYGGLVLSASSDAVSVLIRALAARRTVRVLSRPQVIALDNQTAQIQVGQVVPVPNGVNVTGTGLAQTNVLRDPAGIILTVSPRISPEGQIVMEVAAEKSAYPNPTTGVPIFTDANGNVIYSPIKDITTARSTVKVPDGQTIVVGGMITKSDTTEERKIPWLGDLPVIGKAFRYDSFDYRRTELLIFLTPRIIRNDGDAELIKQVEAGRLHFFQDDVEAVHGPIFGVPPDMALPIETSPPLDLCPADPSQIPPLPPPMLTPDMINPTGAKSIDAAEPRRGVSRLGDLPAESR